MAIGGGLKMSGYNLERVARGQTTECDLAVMVMAYQDLASLGIDGKAGPETAVLAPRLPATDDVGAWDSMGDLVVRVTRGADTERLT